MKSILRGLGKQVYRGGCRKDNAADKKPAAGQRSAAIAYRRRSAGTAAQAVLGADRDHTAGYSHGPWSGQGTPCSLGGIVRVQAAIAPKSRPVIA
jgi:hypothetical protein